MPTKLSRHALAGLAMLVVLAPAPAQAAPPSNDNFSGRSLIGAVPFVDTRDTTEATLESGEPAGSCGEAHGKSVWYEYRPTRNETLQADTLGSNYDTVVSVWTGNGLNSLTEVTCNDDSAEQAQSVAVFSAVASTRYLVQVSGFNGGSGALAFHLGSPTFGSISGTVRSDRGVPLPRICAEVFDPSTWSYVGFQETSPSGTYTVTGIPDGRFQVEFSDFCDERSDFVGEWFDDQPSQETATEIPVTTSRRVLGIDAVLAEIRLTVSISGSGVGIVASDPPGILCGEDCEETYEQDTWVTLTASPEVTSTFAGWSGCETVNGDRCVVFMDAPVSVEAAFDLDTSAPETTITAAPDDPSSSPDATFQFTSSESGSHFECSLDSQGFSSCASPKTYTGLANGEHTFAVRGTDRAGNTDASPATFRWTIEADITPPETTITSGPSGTVTTRNATFEFVASEPGSTFQCSLDGLSFTACTSPKNYGDFAEGTEHTFRVKATDGAGNVDPTPATRTWLVDAEGPSVAIHRPTAGVYVNDQVITETGPVTVVVGSVTVEASASDAQSGVANMRFLVDGTPVDPTKVTFVDGRYRFTFSPQSAGGHTISARATNGSGLVSTQSIQVQAVPA